MITRSWLDDPNERPRLELVPDPPAIPFKQACLPEHGRRILAVAAACDGWPTERTAPLHPFIEAAWRAFELEAAGPWLMALAELERRVGL